MMELIQNLQELCAAYPRTSMGAAIAVMCLVLLPMMMWLMTLWFKILNKAVNPRQDPKV